MKKDNDISSRQILLLFVCLLTFMLPGHNCLGDESKARRFYKTAEPAIADSKHPALHGIEGIIVKHRSGYSIGFSTVVCQSVWVAYRLTVEDVAKCDASELRREGKKPHRDTDLWKYFVSGGWPGGNYQYGHLAPCGDMKYSETAFEDSFNLSNFCPQDKIQNSGGGEWWKWELALHNALSSDRTINPEGPLAEEIYIITGPIYSAPKIKEYIKEKKYNVQAIIIPDSFYKISIMNNVMTCKIFPQDGGVQVVPLKKIQQLTGLEFFPDISSWPVMLE